MSITTTNITNETASTTLSVTNSKFEVSVASIYGNLLCFIIGGFGNVFALASIVYHKLFNKSQIFIFFGFMSAFDAIYILVLPSLVWVRHFIFTRPYTTPDIGGFHDWAYTIVMYSGSVTSFSSIWILVVANLYKTYALFYPLRINATRKRFALSSCIAIVLFFGILHSVALFAYGLVNLGTDTMQVIEYTIRKKYLSLIVVMWPVMLCLYNIIPAFLLPVTALCITIKFRANYKEHRSMTQTSASNDNSAYKQASGAVKSLLPLSLVHIVTSYPASVVTLLDIIGINIAITFYDKLNILLNTNHSVNFYVQMAFSKYYRDAILGR